MKNLLFGLCCLSLCVTFSQEELNPILFQQKTKAVTIKRSSCSFDSTFIYTSDTLSLPFFDEFSNNHFQKYTNNLNDPTLTSDKKYKLLDLSNNPISNNLKYTSQQTLRKTINSSEHTVIDEALPTTQLKLTDFCSYPPVYTQVTAYPPYIIYDTVDFVNDVDTIWLSEVEYVQDSAIQFFAQINDKNSFWLDSKAEHNYTNAVNPWTLGVVTFDGTDENGMPYLFGSTSNDFNDYLTSKPINMEGLVEADSVYFSFLYQPQGYNDEPESTDSLILEFYAPTLDQWFQIWSVGGTPLQSFKKVHIKIKDPKFFKATFQFRFKNYSSVAGSLDQFHLDYVRLQKSSGYQDTLFKDFSVLYPLNTLLNEFTQVPWEHYKNSPTGKMNTNLKINVRNSSNVDENYQNGSIFIENQGALDGTISIPAQDLANGDVNYLSNTVYESFHNINGLYDFNSGLSGDYQEFKTTFTATAQFSNLGSNDSCTFIQRFYDAYAYDDGTAEAAYGPTGVQARLAYQFTPYENDSLVGVRMRFVPSVNNVTSDLFLLTVWDDNNGKPGNVIYEDDFLNPKSPSYEYDDSLGFTNYYFSDYLRLPITGTFYVGWRQLDQRSLNIGFDRNTDQSNKIFYSTNNGITWLNSNFKGSVMMRPIFSTNLNRTLSNQTLTLEKKEPNIMIFPNPFHSSFSIQTDNIHFKGIRIIDINGKEVFYSNSTQTNFNLDHLENGVYFVQDLYNGLVSKIIKN